MNAPTKPAKFYLIPAGTRPAQCNGPNCKATIYWVVNPDTGRKLPVDADVDGGEPPSDTQDPTQRDAFEPSGRANVYDGRGVSHFSTCVDADRFSGRGRK